MPALTVYLALFVTQCNVMDILVEGGGGGEVEDGENAKMLDCLTFAHPREQ